jgi:hypothetical protein
MRGWERKKRREEASVACGTRVRPDSPRCESTTDALRWREGHEFVTGDPGRSTAGKSAVDTGAAIAEGTGLSWSDDGDRIRAGLRSREDEGTLPAGSGETNQAIAFLKNTGSRFDEDRGNPLTVSKDSHTTTSPSEPGGPAGAAPMRADWGTTDCGRIQRSIL